MIFCWLASSRESSFSMKFNTFFYFIILVVHFILAFLKAFRNRWVSCSKLTLSEHFVSFSLDLPSTCFKLRFCNSVILNFITSYSILWTFAGCLLVEIFHSLWNSILSSRLWIHSWMFHPLHIHLSIVNFILSLLIFESISFYF